MTITIKTSFKLFYHEKATKDRFTTQSLQLFEKQTANNTDDEMIAALGAWDQHVFLMRSASNRPQLLHHWKYIPKDTPSNPTGSNAIWALSGHHGAHSASVIISSRKHPKTHQHGNLLLNNPTTSAARVPQVAMGPTTVRNKEQRSSPLTNCACPCLKIYLGHTSTHCCLSTHKHLPNPRWSPAVLLLPHSGQL